VSEVALHRRGNGVADKKWNVPFKGHVWGGSPGSLRGGTPYEKHGVVPHKF